MLYLRESALSAFSGREMVLGSRDVDDDLSRTLPGEPYERERMGDIVLNKMQFHSNLLKLYINLP